MIDYWVFPERLETFKPKIGSKMKKIFNNKIALILFAQYKLNNIIDSETLEFLKWFSLETANKIHNFRKENNNKKLTLEQAVSIWIECWRYSSKANQLSLHAVKASYSREKWKEIIEPILPYINGEKKLELVKEYYLISK